MTQGGLGAGLIMQGSVQDKISGRNAAELKSFRTKFRS